MGFRKICEGKFCSPFNVTAVYNKQLIDSKILFVFLSYMGRPEIQVNKPNFI